MPGAVGAGALRPGSTRRRPSPCRLCWQGCTRQAFCSHPGLPARRTTIRLSRRAVTMGVSKPSPPRMSALLPLNWRYDFPIFPGWLANTTISFGWILGLSTPGVARSAGVCSGRKISLLTRLACKRINDAYGCRAHQSGDRCDRPDCDSVGRSSRRVAPPAS
jgi:hypothetical protein